MNYYTYFYLAIAIIAEVIATSSLKAVKGFSTPIPLITVIVGYGLSFWLLSLVLKTMPVGIAYAIWCGCGIILVCIISWLIYGQKLDLPAIIGISLIIAGVITINLFSNKMH